MMPVEAVRDIMRRTIVTSGAVIPAADIVLNRDGARQSAKTQADGSYSFSALAPGEYRVSAAFRAFNRWIEDIEVLGSARECALVKVLHLEHAHCTAFWINHDHWQTVGRLNRH